MQAVYKLPLRGFTSTKEEAIQNAPQLKKASSKRLGTRCNEEGDNSLHYVIIRYTLYVIIN